jgi:hypothetical protein
VKIYVIAVVIKETTFSLLLCQISIIIIIIIIISGVRLDPLGTAATIALLYQPQMMVTVEQLVE